MPSHPSPSAPHRFVFALLVLMIGAIPPKAAAQDSADHEKLRSLALELVNKARAEHKLPPLHIGKEINEAATFHASDMLRRNYYDHSSPEGKTVQDRYMKAGGSRWRITAENIARCTGCDLSAKTVEELQQGWMNSKGHRENILRKGITEFGFGIASAQGKPLYAVQTFTGPGTPNDTSPGEQASSFPRRRSSPRRSSSSTRSARRTAARLSSRVRH